MKKIKLKSLLLRENIEISDLLRLEEESKKFVQTLVDSAILTSKHKDLTTADVNASQYVEDIAEVVRNEIIHWMNTVNKRGGR